MKKECRKCHEHKELNNENFPHNSKSKDGFDGYCKACWKLISQNKRKSNPQEGAQKAVKAKGKLRAWEVLAKEKPKVEIVPNDVEVVSLGRFADLPGNGIKLMMSEGSLVTAIEEYVKKYGKRPQLVYTPAKFYLQEPSPEKVVPAKKAVKPVKVVKKKGKKK